MRNEFDTNDDVLFDRLVDGELSAEERRQLLATLDDRPGGWRQCALAFLEAQTWQQELGHLVREPRETAEITRAGDGPAGRRQSVSFYVLAASVMIAFTLGLALRLNSLPPQIATPTPFNPNQLAATGPEQIGSPQRKTPDDALTLWVRDSAGRATPLRVPLVDASAMDRQLGLQFQPALPPGMRDQLEQDGYHVESKRRYAPFWLENGRPLVVPVEDTRIVPIGGPVY